MHLSKILLVEDNLGDARLVEELLLGDGNGPFEIIRAHSLATAVPLLEKHQIAAVLLDLKLPDAEGLETLTRMHTAVPGVPIVVLSADEDETLAVRSVQQGAQDFLVKGNISSLLLRRSLSYAIERKRMAEQLHHMAHHDVLTGLANRKLFYDRLKQAINLARRAGRRSALMFLDLTDFKLINDSQGHHVGDLLLQGVAGRLGGIVRASDCVARMGGDEFTIILSEIRGAQDASLIAEKLLNVLSEPFILDSRPIQAIASVGIAIYPDDGDDADTLIRAADAAMYQAKQDAGKGSNCYRFFCPKLAAKASGYAENEQRLRDALQRGEFVLHFQPEVNARNSEIIGMEALLRWQHPEQGLLTPASFMGALEETGLIVPVGEWALRTACTQSKKWQEQGLPPMMMSVNVSPRQFRQSNFIDSVAQALRHARLDGSLLELEFTETLLREDEERSIQVLEQLSRLGVKLTLDNFGSGIVSFKSLMTFPIHAIKIDRSLIQDKTHGSGGAAIAKAAIEVAHIFQIKSLAEGVETSADLDRVQQIDCDDAQGYLYSRPLPADVIPDLIRGNRLLHPKKVN